MSAKHEGMIVHGDDCRCRSCSDVSEAASRGRVGADAAEICVVEGRLSALVESWSGTRNSSKFFLRRSVP